ncbi:MAG: response regulator [Granulosicoccus sp.]|nr:response regulator [Granulosicoccus sp.]
MSIDSSLLLDVIAPIGGGRHGYLNDLTSHFLCAVAWATLAVYQIAARWSSPSDSRRLLIIALSLASAIEILLWLSVAAKSMGGDYALVAENQFGQAALLALGSVSRMLVVIAFAHFLIRRRALMREAVIVALLSTVVLFLYTTFNWWTNLPPGPVENRTYSWVFDGALILLCLGAGGLCVCSAKAVRWPVIAAFLLIVIESGLAIAAYQWKPVLAQVLVPISGSIKLASILVLGYAGMVFHVISENRTKNSMQNSRRLESLGLLSSGIAHDFNNHLQIILGYVELAKAQAGEKHALQTSVNRIAEAAEKSGALVNQLLAFSRGQSPDFVNIDLNETITKLTPLLSRLVSSEIKLIHKLDLRARSINADTRMIEQIILNLVANAKDAIEHQGSITIETRQLNEEDLQSVSDGPTAPTTQLVVSDTGRGIDKSIVGKVFEPFFTTKAVGEGTGLGLATVHSAVQKHNGAVRVKSKPGKFTKVYIDFPSAESSVALTVEQLPSEMSASPVETALQGNSITILLAEDEPAIQELTCMLLEAAGYSVINASNGQHAINIINTYKGKIDLCLFDVAMPVLSGYQTYDRIIETQPSMPVLFTTGNTARVDDLRSQFEHLQKPFTKKTLLTSLSRILNQDRHRYHSAERHAEVI